MSLTYILKEPKYRNMFKERFPKPECNLYGEMLAIPQTKNYAIVGSAFDYVLRFYIEHMNPNVSSRIWIAKEGLNELQLFTGDWIQYGTEMMKIKEYKDLEEKAYKSGKMVEFRNMYKNVRGISNITDAESESKYSTYKQMHELAEKMYLNAVSRYKEFLNNGIMTRSLLRDSIFLAQLDGIYRTGRVDVFHPINERDVDDLENLLNVAKEIDFFSTFSHCILNPIFGTASALVKGADADLIIGDTLIDIKTTMHPKEQFLDAWLQIVGYHILNMINNDAYQIKNIGIYFSRHGMLRIFPVSMLGNIDIFIRSFKEEIIAEYCE